jgi:hypothetical protein
MVLPTSGQGDFPLIHIGSGFRPEPFHTLILPAIMGRIEVLSYAKEHRHDEKKCTCQTE